MEKRVGIITFHSAYNYGSVLQAYATQEAIIQLGYNAEIINYRPAKQKEAYSNFHFHQGIKTMLRDITLLPIYSDRKMKYEKFEEFLEKRLHLTEVRENAERVNELWSSFPIMVSGSDQIWNQHSLELEGTDMKKMYPYLLHGYCGKKISYASSIASKNDNELKKLQPFLEKFSHISMREKSSADIMSNLLQSEIPHVLDPTFLLTRNDWIERFNLSQKNTRYILYYSLRSMKYFNSIKNDLIRIAKENQCKMILVMPFCYVPTTEYFEPHPECGPIEFLNLIYNAKLVVTDSYHGTILSVNFGKNVFSVCKNKNASEYRKIDILRLLGIENRIVFNINDISCKNLIDYHAVYERLALLRKNSLTYLQNALLE